MTNVRQVYHVFTISLCILKYAIQNTKYIGYGGTAHVQQNTFCAIQLIIDHYTCTTYYGLAVASPYVGMARFQNGGSNQCVRHQRFHGNIIAGDQMLAYKSTQSNLKGLPQCTEVMATYSNDFKGANVKRPKIRIVLSFFNQSSTVTRKVLRSKLPPAREFSGGGAFSLCFERNWDITPALFDCGGRVYQLLGAICRESR